MKAKPLLTKAAKCKTQEDADKLLDTLERVFGNASPEEVRAVRKRLKLTQLDAAQVTSIAEGKSYRSWQNFETDKGKPNHRQIPRATRELFLLLTSHPPYYCLVSRED